MPQLEKVKATDDAILWKINECHFFAIFMILICGAHNMYFAVQHYEIFTNVMFDVCTDSLVVFSQFQSIKLKHLLLWLFG